MVNLMQEAGGPKARTAVRTQMSGISLGVMNKDPGLIQTGNKLPASEHP